MLLEYYDHLCCVLLQLHSTALHFAAADGKNKVMRYLIDQGAKVDDVNDVS